MGTLLNRICKACGAKTYEDNGFVQCDCIMVDKDAWANGVSETPKDWVSMLRIPNDPRIRFVNDGEDVSIRLRQGQHTYTHLVIIDMRFEAKGFGWFTEQVAMDDEHQTEPRYFPTLEETVDDVLHHLRASDYVAWTNITELIESFLAVNHE